MKISLKIRVCCSLLALFLYSVQAQEKEDTQKYRRSTLTMILLQGTSYTNDGPVDADEVKVDCSPEAITRLWNEYPFPDMYDKFDIPNAQVYVASNLSSKDIFAARKGGQQRKDAKATLPKIEKELKDKQVAKQIVRRWFSSEDGSRFWDMGTIQKHAYYNATMSEVSEAMQDVRGMAKIGDAGEELLNNSFVTVTDLLIYANRPIAERYFQVANELTNSANNMNVSAGGIAGLVAAGTQAGLLTSAAALMIAGEAIKDGYSVFSKTYLFKLKWNDKIADELYSNWGNDAAFEKMDFQLEFVGVQLNETIVNRGAFNKKANRKPEVVIKTAVVRNIDETFAMLQQEHEVFKPSVPFLSIDPITAQIGMKEGLQGGEKFNVLQKSQDPISGKISYKKVGMVTVDKKYVWDNRYNAGDKPEHVNHDKNGNPITVTYFKGGGNVVPGMLLKQAKTKKKKSKSKPGKKK